MRAFSRSLLTIAIAAYCFSIAAQTVIPDNASVVLGIGSTWICNPGYRKIGSECVEFNLPENARFTRFGNNWLCLRGYKRQAERCLKIPVPHNARLDIVGYDWVCNEGFTENAFGCIPLSEED
ncbi:MAG: hypothetical protein GKR91_12490 [Pseudomonadales bacterium]|nr:hypothetical protein [Pseudomonadales bacterium]